MKARRWLPATLLAALLAPGGARAEGLEGRFSIAFQAGTQSELAGDLLKAADGTLVGKPVTIESKRYRDVYSPDLRLQGLLGYGIGERIEIIARGTWYKAEATGLQVGTLNDNPVFAFFDPYEEVGVEVGLRYYIAAAGRLKSYVAPVAGARFLTEVLVSFHVPDAGSYILNVPFSGKSTVPVFGLDLGFTFDLGTHVFVGVDTSLRYQAAPSQLDGLAGFTQIDDSGGKWSSPVVASLGLRF
jgi:hypothetical protein